MFKLESYITPLLMGYIDKYVKLNKEDFQLSLWGGDVVLNKVDLRLDVIEETVNLPIIFKSGFIHELRIHVPWTRIYYEPVVITVNTIECILKLRGSSSEDLETVSSKSDTSSTKRPNLQPIRATKVEEEDLPPGYIQSLINKIIHNVNIVINNLILKFVEDDIVLSLNVKSAECYSVDNEWKRSFIELALPDLMLRRVLDFHDLTVCLDKRNADGKIESYQEPVLYRCALLTRMLMHYESLNSKLPQLVKMNALCEKLDMSLTNVQLPMFFRLIDLCLALYYGTMEMSENSKQMPRRSSSEMPQDGPVVAPEQLEQGWMSWMWSYVPAVLPVEEYSTGEEEGGEGSRVLKKMDAAVFVLGIYVTEASVLLKMYELVQSSSMFAAVKLVAKPFLIWKFNGISMEMKIQSDEFTDVQFGIRDCHLAIVDKISRRTDAEIIDKDGVFFEYCNDPSKEFKLTYTSGSLFDASSPENNGRVSTYIFDAAEYLDTFNESSALDRFGIFWMSYLFTCVNSKDRTLIRFLIGPCRLSLSSTPVRRVKRVVDILLVTERDFYYRSKKTISERELKSATEEDMEKFSDTTTAVVYRLTILQPLAVIHEVDVATLSTEGAARRDSKRTRDSEAVKLTIHPAIVLQAENVEMEIRVPVHARQIMEMGFKLSSNLVDSCYSNLIIKVRQMEAGLVSILGTASSAPFLSSTFTILQPLSIQFSWRNLLLPELWRNPLQPQDELCLDSDDGMTFSFTKPQLLLLVHVLSSWIESSWIETTPGNETRFIGSLMDDVFAHSSGGKMAATFQHSVVEFLISNFHIRLVSTEAVYAAKVNVSTVQMFLLGVENGKEFTIPLLVGPLDASNVISKNLFRTEGKRQPVSELKEDLLSLTFQVPKDATIIQAPVVLYLECGSIISCLDPRLLEWLAYKPSPQEPPNNCDMEVSLNPSIANATLPLIQRSSIGSESDRSINESTESRTSFRASQMPTPTSNRISQTSLDKKILPAEAVKDKDSSQRIASWGSTFSSIFPFVKILELQINVENWCFILPSQPLCLSEPTVDFGEMLSNQFDQRCLSDTLVLCCPSLYVSSAGRKKSDSCSEIPIRSLEHSIASEKLPWTISLVNCNLYTILQSQVLWNLLKPMSIGATLAVITKYQLPPSENLSQLGLCMHTDLDSVVVCCSKKQFQLVYDVMTKVALSATAFLQSFDLISNLFTATRKVDDPLAENHLISLKINNTSSVFDSAALTNDSEMTRTVSEDMCTDARFEESGTIKLTFWLQCTLTKLSIQLFGEDEKQRELCVKSDLDDITVAVDVQEVYTKAKCKFGNVCVSHYVRTGESWVSGDHEGILVFCTHQFKHSRPMLYQRNWKTSEFIFSDSSAYAEGKGIDSRKHGFLAMTYTRAQTENAAKKLSETFDAAIYSDKPIKHHYKAGITYLEEICFTLQPLSIVYHGPIIVAVIDVFTLPSVGGTPCEATGDLRDDTTSKFEENFTNLPVLTSRNMPLMNVDVKEFSLFFPNLHASHDLSSIDDVCVLHVSSVKVISQPENPLPRLVVFEKDIYRSALHAGITGCPGSEVEDRQYQLDICGLEICSSSWKDLVSCGRHLQKISQSSSVQNPAFEWNMSPLAGVGDEVRIFPLISGCDLRIVFAPAVVFGSTAELLQVVCGYSMEVNARSDLEIFLTVDQIRLLYQILESNITAARNSSQTSDTATSQRLSDKQTPSTSVVTSPFAELQNCTQFVVLLTGGKLSVMLYSHEVVADVKSLPQDHLHGDVSTAVPRYRIVPFLFGIFSQPHLIVTHHKMELSCYDIMVNGSSHELSEFAANKIVPVYSDFSTHWLETKAGKSDPNTGILTSFCTIVVTNYITSSADLEISIGRPLRVLASSTKIRQVLDFLGRINVALTDQKESFSQNSFPHKKPPDPKEAKEEMLELIKAASSSWMKSMRLSTVQLVAVMEFGSGGRQKADEQSSDIMLALSSLEASLRCLLAEPDQVQRVIFDLLLNDAVAKTGLNGCFTQLLGPLSSLSISVTAAMMKSFGFPEWHRFITFLHCQNIQVYCSEDIILSLQQTNQSLQELLLEAKVEELATQPTNTSHGDSRTVSPVCSNTDGFQCLSTVPVSETYDDLKAEFFNYLNVEKEGCVPNPGEIMFFSNADEGLATMTWRYFEPRVLTSVKAMQVPFSIQRHHSAAAFDENLRVPCILQFSLSMGETFEDYSEFFLSQNQSSQADLPDLMNAENAYVVAADIWRVVIHMPPSDGHTSEEMDLLVSPMTLAASLRVDSRFVAKLLPTFYFTSQVDCSQLRILHKSSQLAKVNSGPLAPYRLIDKGPKREVGIATLENFSLMASSSGSKHWQLHMKTNATACCHVLEYRSLNLLPLLEKCSISSDLNLKSTEKQLKLQVAMQLDRVFTRVSQSIVQTLTDIALSWQQLNSPNTSLLAYYIICNNSMEELHFGQVETDEDITLQSREACSYSWKSCGVKQALKVMPKGYRAQGSALKDIDIDQEGVTCTSVITASGQDAVLAIKVSKMSTALKQVTISGLTFFTSWIDRPLNVKFMCKNSAKEANFVINPRESSPSCVMGISDLRAVRLNVTSSSVTGWSQEILVSDVLLDQLVRVPLSQPSECIYVWCHLVSQKHSTVTETMVVFCPLFVVKSHFPAKLLMNVRRSKLKLSSQMELEGRGVEEQLDIEKRDLAHLITFQINSAALDSSPALTISTDTIEQVERITSADTDILQLAKMWCSDGIEQTWPYNSTDGSMLSLTQLTGKNDLSWKSQLESPSALKCASDMPELNFDQPNIELRVSLSQFWPGLNTLRIDVLPHWLVVNESGLDVVITESNSQTYKLSAGRTIAPPVIKGLLKVGVVQGGQIHLSDDVVLSDEEQRTSFPIRDALYLEGHIPICIAISHDGLLIRHCFLTLHSKFKQEIRVITIREQFHFVNRTPFDLQLYITTVKFVKNQKVFVPDDPNASLVVNGREESGDDDPESSKLLLLWDVLQAGKTSNSKAKFLPHIRFKYLASKSEKSATRIDSSALWSYPIQLNSELTETRHSVALPCFDGSYLTTKTCVLTSVLFSDVVYLVLEQDFHPSIELINNCNVTLYYGQAAFSSKGSHGTVTHEESGVIANLPSVRSRSSCHYTLPVTDALFPEIHDSLSSAKLHIGAMSTKQEVIWSHALDVQSDQSIFVVIPKVLDLKVDIKRHGFTIHVHLNPVSRAEVSAKEIRSRIKGKSVVTIEEVGKPRRKISLSRTISDSASEIKEGLDEVDVRQDLVSEFRREERNSNPLQIELSCFCREASILLSEELPNSTLSSCLCVTLDEIGILLQPKVDFAQPNDSSTLNLLFLVYDMQVDNPLFASGCYDFPVLMKRSENSKCSSENRPAQNIRDRIKLVQGSSMISVSAELHQDTAFNTISLQSLQIAMEPLMLFVEDTYCWDLLKIIDRLIPCSFSVDPGKKTVQDLPLCVKLASANLATPIRLRYLCIEPVSAQLSIHASLKLFISSDRAPLSFGRFRRNPICTSAQQLLRALAMHYAVSAVYRAALVFGSLEILGNPTGLVRSIGSGVADMIWLPYEGLTKGPGPCISGFSGGMKSVARHFSAGTLTSITNFASSISRNMERLSMDDEHIKRNEITRRRRPSGLSEGLINGLSGFGLSVLGAIAGVADQPLQTFTRSDSTPTSTSDKARGVVSGFGKGLLGMVTKPIGGAAELVSQTSLGLLQGIGLVDALRPRHDEKSWPAAVVRAGSAKFREKTLHLLPSDEVLFYINDCLMITKRTSCTCSLVLTSSCFCVLSERQEEQLCTFPITDVSLEKCKKPDGAVYLVLQSANEASEINQQGTSARLAAFIGDATLAAASLLLPADEWKLPKTPAADKSVQTKYEFHSDSGSINTLVSWFVLAKAKSRRDSFPI